MSSSCKFCEIARGEIDAHVVYADDGFLAFLDHRPLFPGHALLGMYGIFEVSPTASTKPSMVINK